MNYGGCLSRGLSSGDRTIIQLRETRAMIRMVRVELRKFQKTGGFIMTVRLAERALSVRITTTFKPASFKLWLKWSRRRGRVCNMSIRGNWRSVRDEWADGFLFCKDGRRDASHL